MTSMAAVLTLVNIVASCSIAMPTIVTVAGVRAERVVAVCVSVAGMCVQFAFIHVVAYVTIARIASFTHTLKRACRVHTQRVGTARLELLTCTGVTVDIATTAKQRTLVDIMTLYSISMVTRIAATGQLTIVKETVSML